LRKEPWKKFGVAKVIHLANEFEQSKKESHEAEPEIPPEVRAFFRVLDRSPERGQNFWTKEQILQWKEADNTIDVQLWLGLRGLMDQLSRGEGGKEPMQFDRTKLDAIQQFVIRRDIVEAVVHLRDYLITAGVGEDMLRPSTALSYAYIDSLRTMAKGGIDIKKRRPFRYDQMKSRYTQMNELTGESTRPKSSKFPDILDARTEELLRDVSQFELTPDKKQLREEDERLVREGGERLKELMADIEATGDPEGKYWAREFDPNQKPKPEKKMKDRGRG